MGNSFAVTDSIDDLELQAFVGKQVVLLNFNDERAEQLNDTCGTVIEISDNSLVVIASQPPQTVKVERENLALWSISNHDLVKTLMYTSVSFRFKIDIYFDHCILNLAEKIMGKF